MKRSRLALFQSVISLILCFSMLVGTTFAWFTDSVASGNNVIATGSLDVKLEYLDAKKEWQPVDGSTEVLDKSALWEPGHTEVAYLRITNAGSLALKYALGVGILAEETSVNNEGKMVKLSDHIRFGVVETTEPVSYANRSDAIKALTSSKPISESYASSPYVLEKNGQVRYATLVVYMPEEVGNDANYATGQKEPKVELGIKLEATQAAYESDSFGTDYDSAAALKGFGFPKITYADMASVKVTVDENNRLKERAVIKAATSTAVVPAGVKVKEGTEVLTLTVTSMNETGSNVELGENEIMKSLDIHVEGVAEDNDVPMEITVTEAAAPGLNMGNLTLYHVMSDGTDVKMQYVASDAEFTEKNQFKYDAAAGDVTVNMADFSEVAMVADEVNAWEGNFDYSWYTNAVAPADGEAETEYIIANADQLAGFGAIVGGMDGQTQDSFEDKTVKLIAEVNLGDDEEHNNENIIFYPIGYYNSEGTYERTNTAITSGLRNFEGTFDGNGHTISNFYQNTWEMKGDHDWYSPEEQYYRDGMGLFGRVYGATVKNLTVKNFSSDGEIATTGVIAAYADGATFENIAVFNCNPRVYNIGNGGIVGCVGWYAKEADLKTTFKNITVDNSNKISALWGSYDVACGGIVGQYYPTSGQSSAGTPKNAGLHFENCHISAQMDVYNDVCANYQYYAYRYTGMLIGSVRENVTVDGHSYPKMDGITASGCTVHFGTWNDYYYCEIIDNTTASYTHDYQMSRLTEIKAIDGTTITYLDGTTDTVPASGRANYVIVDYTKGHGTENATCHHFKDGAVWTHDMGGKETVNGVEVLKEDKQHLYLEFNNLVTGYGWGVTSKGVGDLDGVTILDREVGNSVEKFKGKVAELANNKEYKLGEIFEFVDNGVKLVPEALTVTVTNLNEKDVAPVSGKFELDKDNWNKSVLTLSGTGKASITIQDYYFCTPTTIEVTVDQRTEEKKFETKFTGDFLYRVGNTGAVSWDTLFEAKDGVTVGTVSVTVEEVEGTGASGTYSNNAIQFSGTGVVKVTITDNDYCTPTELMLEVVDAKNHASESISSLGSGNVVLLCDTKLNNNGALALQNASLYGNDFEIDVSAGKVAGESITANYLLYLNNGILDNVRIRGAVYTNFDVISSNAYNNPTVLSVGNSKIVNSLISNCASPVRVRSGNLEIVESTLQGGFFANLDIRGGHVILDNATTINQVNLNEKSSDGKDIAGLGIVFFYEGPTSDTTLEIRNNLTQHNLIAEDYNANSYANMLVKEIFGNETYDSICITDEDGKRWANTGILSLSAAVNSANINTKNQNKDNKESYTGMTVNYTIPGQLTASQGYLYTIAQPDLDKDYTYKSDAFYEVIPHVSFDHTINAVTKTESSETSCSHDPLTDTENITFANGGSFEWKTRILVSENKEIEYTVWMDDIQCGDTITFDETGSHLITFKYVDHNNYRKDEEGKLVKYSKNYETSITVTVTEKEATAKSAEITFPLLESYGTTTVVVDGKTYIMPNLSGTDIPKYGDDLTFDASTRKYGSLKADGRANVDIYYPIIKTAISGNYMVFPVFGNKNGTLVQIQDYADRGAGDPLTPYNASTQSMPAGLSVSRGYTVQWKTDKEVVGSGSMSYGGWTDGLLAFKYQSSSDDIACKVMSGYLSYYPNINLKSNDRNEQVMVAEYKYVDNKGDTYYYCVGYHIEKRNSGYAFGDKVPENSGGCVTPDTLITLADGSQVRVDSLTGTEELLVWNLETGKYDTAPIVFVDNDAEQEYEIIHLYFSDGSDVKVISEHGFFDLDLGKYVYIDASNYDAYVGHRFVTEGDMKSNNWNVVTLDKVVLETEVTTAWSPVTFSHLCYYTNGVLSMPGGIEGLFNIFEVDTDLMRYDAEKMQKDIETFGLLTVEDFGGMITEDAFHAFNGAYLNIAMAKGLLTWEDIAYMAERYIPLM